MHFFALSFFFFFFNLSFPLLGEFLEITFLVEKVRQLLSSQKGHNVTWWDFMHNWLNNIKVEIMMD